MNDVRQTILIVDDDQEIVNLLKAHFKERNCETVATTDPGTVVAKLENFSIALMLLDLKMASLDGFKVLDKIRQAGLELPPTIIITGFLSKYQERLRAYHIHPNDIITKPFAFETLEASINRKLGQQIVPSEVGSEYEEKIYEKNNCHVGIVDDEEDLLEILSDFFTQRKYQVSCFKNGALALDGLRKNPVDILFVDIKLPGIQGDELIERLSKSDHPPYMIPISADPLPDDMRRKLAPFGCKDFIEKPFDVTQLIEIVKTIAIEKGLLG